MKPRIADMQPELQVKYAAFAARLSEAAIPFALLCVLRTPAEQAAYYAQGRETLAEINRLRAAANMRPLQTKESLLIVTHTKNSRHFPDNKGQSTAFDIVVLRNGGKMTWDTKWDGNNDGISDYLEAAFIGKALGLECGAFWKGFNDYPHYQLAAKG